MSNNLSPKIAITKRDEKLFNYLYLNKVATNRQISRDIFDNASKQVVYRRIDKLIRSRFVEATYMRERENRLVYSLSDKTVREYIGEKIDMRRVQRKSQSIYHDLALVDIRKAILSCTLIKSYLTENAILSGLFRDDEIVNTLGDLSPDAIVEISSQKERVFLPLEFERSTKFSYRYDKLITKYQRSVAAQAVLFISESKKIQQRVMQSEKRILKTANSKFYHLLLSDLLLPKTQRRFININKEVLMIH